MACLIAIRISPMSNLGSFEIYESYEQLLEKISINAFRKGDKNLLHIVFFLVQCRIELEKARLLVLEAADQLDRLGNKKARGTIAMAKVNYYLIYM